MNAPKLVNLVNMRGSMAGYFAFSEKTLCVDSTVDDFLAPEARCKEVLAKAYKNSKSRRKLGKPMPQTLRRRKTCKDDQLGTCDGTTAWNRHNFTNTEHGEDKINRKPSE